MPWRVLAAAVVLTVATPSAASGDEAFSLTVSPARTVGTLVDGRAEEPFRVANGGTEVVHVRAVVGTFAQRPSGAVVFLDEDADSASSLAAASPTSFDLGPGDSR